MRRYLRVYGCAWKQAIRMIMLDRADFVLELIGTTAIALPPLIFVQVIFEFVPELRGWKKPEVLFIYGLFVFLDFLTWALHGALPTLHREMKEGTWDYYLSTPINFVFFHVIQWLDTTAIGPVFAGLAVFSSAWSQLGIEWGLTNVLALIFFVVNGVVLGTAVRLLFMSSILLILGSEAASDFWDMAHVVFRAADMAQYPVNIYFKGLQIFLTWIFPYAMISFVPSTYFLGAQGYRYELMLLPVVTIGFAVLTSRVVSWSRMRYDSGSAWG